MKIGKHVITPFWGDIQISKYKSFEYQFEGPSFLRDQIVECGLRWTTKTDHAGISFTKLFWFNLNIHDRRHWDYDNNCWQQH